MENYHSQSQRYICDPGNDNLGYWLYTECQNLQLPWRWNNPDSKVHGANMGPPGSCWPQMGPRLSQWTLIPGNYFDRLLTSFEDNCLLCFICWGDYLMKNGRYELHCIVHFQIHEEQKTLSNDTILPKHDMKYIYIYVVLFPYLLCSYDVAMLPYQSVFNCIHYKMLGDITYPFLNFNDSAIEVWEWISHFSPNFNQLVIIQPCWDLS